MCYTKPGPRCSGHMRTRKTRAELNLATVMDKVGVTPEEIAAARARLEKADEEWKKTPEGIEYLTELGVTDPANLILARKYADDRKLALAALRANQPHAEIAVEDEKVVGDIEAGEFEAENFDPNTPASYPQHENREAWAPVKGMAVIYNEDTNRFARDISKQYIYPATYFDAVAVVEALQGKTDDPILATTARLADEDKEALLAQIQGMYESGDIEGLNALIESRVTDPRFTEAISLRNEERDAFQSLEQSYRVIKADLEGEKTVASITTLENGITQINMKTAGSPENEDFEKVREAALMALSDYERTYFIEAEINQYKGVTAQAAFYLEELRMKKEIEEGTATFFTGDELNGKATKIDNFASGSKEWLESRQSGIGGSDIGKIMGMGEKEYAKAAFIDVLASKALPIPPEEMERQANKDYASYTGRGDAWEDAIVRRFREARPDENVVYCKTSWKSKEFEYMNTNYDGLLADKDGNIDGILEIKTGSNLEKWGPESEGINGIPEQYAAQTLWYAKSIGAKRVKLVALIDDTDLRIYEYDITPELETVQSSMMRSAKEFWEKDVAEAKAAGKLPTNDPIIYGIPQGAVASPERKNTKEARRAMLANIAAYRDETPEQTTRAYYTELNRMGTDDANAETFVREAAFKRLYFNYDPSTRTRPIVGIDLETSGFTPTRGRIIETGISVQTRGADGKYVESEGMKRLHGITPMAVKGRGTGMVEVHNITTDMIHNKAWFSRPENQEQILAMLKKGPDLAHNKGFEQRWLDIHLPGHYEARKRGEIRYVDTMMMSRHLLDTTSGRHRLRDDVETLGDQYVNAHRAYEDVKMTIDVFEKFEKGLRSRTIPFERAPRPEK